MEKIRCDLAPSTKLKVGELLPAFNFLFRLLKHRILEKYDKPMDFPEIEVDEHMMALTEKSSYFEDHNRVTRVVKESARCCMMGIFGHTSIGAEIQKHPISSRV